MDQAAREERCRPAARCGCAAVDVLAAAPAQLAAAVEADEEALRAAISEAPTEEVRTLLQQALNGVMQHGWVPPQAVLLMSQPNGIPPVRITPVLE